MKTNGRRQGHTVYPRGLPAAAIAVWRRRANALPIMDAHLPTRLPHLLAMTDSASQFSLPAAVHHEDPIPRHVQAGAGPGPGVLLPARTNRSTVHDGFPEEPAHSDQRSHHTGQPQNQASESDEHSLGLPSGLVQGQDPDHAENHSRAEEEQAAVEQELPHPTPRGSTVDQRPARRAPSSLDTPGIPGRLRQLRLRPHGPDVGDDPPLADREGPDPLQGEAGPGDAVLAEELEGPAEDASRHPHDVVGPAVDQHKPTYSVMK